MIAQWAAAEGKKYSRDLVLWGEGLVLKQNTCVDALEAQTAK